MFSTMVTFQTTLARFHDLSTSHKEHTDACRLIDGKIALNMYSPADFVTHHYNVLEVL